jgi:hypothetical protein
MNELIQILCCHSRRVEVYWLDLYSVKVYNAKGKLLVHREGTTVEKALSDAVEVFVTHGERVISK